MSGFSDFTAETITLADGESRIRRATAADVPSLVALLRDDELGAGREGTGDEDETGHRHAFRLIDEDPNQLLVAIDDLRNGSQPGRTEAQSPAIAGTLQLTLIPSLSRRGSTRLQIEAVRIGPGAQARRCPGAQGLGLATAVFEWAHDCGRRFGASLAQLTTDKTRMDAQRFYARLGYEASHEGLKRDLS